MTNIDIILLSNSTELQYELFLERCKEALFYHSLKYRNFLRKILKSSRDIYLLAIQNNQIVAVLPAFITYLDDRQSIINSLPFYGSHGGVLVADGITQRIHIMTSLMNELLSIANKNNTLSITFVDNPVRHPDNFYEQCLQMDATDYRISQITDITVTNTGSIEEQLMAKFHSKTRNMIRKSFKSKFSIAIDNTFLGFEKIHAIHSENMKIIGGKEKSLTVFESLYQSFQPGKDYQIYFAYKNGEIAAGLLLFYYKNYCEYYTPVINEKFRSDQPLSRIIFHAMREAVQRSVQYWNWGGTWITQEGVYLFKKRWGATDTRYNYYTKVFNNNILSCSLDSIIKNAAYYYVKKL